MAVSMGGAARGSRGRSGRWIDAWSPFGALLAGLAVIGAFGLGGVAYELDVYGTQQFDLDGEYKLGALCSGALLLVAAALALGLRRRPGSRPLVFLAVLLAFMGLDEVAVLHERLEEWLAIDWRLLYGPLVPAAAWAWLVLWRRVGDVRGARTAMGAGAAAWALAQALELAQWDGAVRQEGYATLMVLEELGEMAGSLLLLVALLAVARSAVRPSARPVDLADESFLGDGGHVLAVAGEHVAGGEPSRP
jgi:hypothetical protein